MVLYKRSQKCQKHTILLLLNRWRITRRGMLCIICYGEWFPIKFMSSIKIRARLLWSVLTENGRYRCSTYLCRRFRRNAVGCCQWRNPGRCWIWFFKAVGKWSWSHCGNDDALIRFILHRTLDFACSNRLAAYAIEIFGSTGDCTDRTEIVGYSSKHAANRQNQKETDFSRIFKTKSPLSLVKHNKVWVKSFFSAMDAVGIFHCILFLFCSPVV